MLVIENVYALGIVPSRKIIDYSTEEQAITVNIINSEARDMTVKISVSGPLSEYITIDQPILHISSEESEKAFTYTIKLPPDVSPGTKEIDILATETNEDSGETTVSGRFTLTHQLLVNVPYNGLYAEGEISVSSTTKNAPVFLVMNIINRGDQIIQSIKGTLNIKDKNDNLIYTKNIGEDGEYNNIFPEESAKIEESLNLNNAGTYIAEFEINYDTKNFTVTKEFDLGEYNITILGADVKNFKLGTIAKLNINLSSEWNDPIDNVYGEVTLKENNGTVVGKTNITDIIITPNRNSLTAYLDTANVKSGAYNIEIQLRAGSKLVTQRYPAIIEDDKILIGDETTIKPIINSNIQYISYSIAALLLVTAMTLIIMLYKNIKAKKL